MSEQIFPALWVLPCCMFTLFSVVGLLLWHHEVLLVY